MNTALHELYTTKFWSILPSSVSAFRKALDENIKSHRTFDHNGMPGCFLTRSNNFEPFDTQHVTSNPQRDIENPWYAFIKDDDEFINLVNVSGGITRNGACGYGSKAQRDQVLYAAKKPNCIGHIFLIDTPGGSAYSIEDYKEAINAAREAGQPVIACIDGLCASAGYGLACQCDAIYYTHAHNEVGCIGTMAIYYTNKDGDVNTVTQETYHEVYDPESFDKNIEHRQSADGDDTLILECLSEHGRQFRDLVTKCRPNVKDEQLHGKVFKAAEVEGTLVDGLLSLQGCIDMLCEKASPSPAPVPDASPSADAPLEDDPEYKCNPKKKASLTAESNSAQSQTTVSDADASAIPNSQTTMPLDNNIQTALVEAQAALTEVNDKLSLKETELANANSLIEEKDKSIADLQSQLDKANADIEASKADTDKTVADLQSQIEKANKTIEEKSTEVSNLIAQLEEANKAIEQANADILTLKDDSVKAIADLQAQLDKANADLAELSTQPTSTATPTPATAAEGEGDEGKAKPEYATASKPGMSIEERRAAQLARDKALGLA